MSIKFKCPDCGCEVLTSVEVDMTVTSIISNIGVEGDFNYADNPTIDGDQGVDQFALHPLYSPSSHQDIFSLLHYGVLQ